MRNCVKIRLRFAILPALSAIFILSSGCSEDVMKKLKEPIFKSSAEKPSQPAAKTASTRETPAEKPPKPTNGNCVVNIDSGLAYECDVLVDGGKKATLKPFAVIELGLKKGKHEFRFMRGQEEADRISAELADTKTTVINPLAAGTYNLFTIYYTTGGPFSGRDPSSETITSQRVVQADYGLLQAIPESIMVRTSRSFIQTPYNAKTDTRTKLCRSVSPAPTTMEAIAMLTSSQSVYVIHDSSGMDHVLRPAIKQLGDANKDPAIMDALLGVIETCRGNSGSANLDVVFEALKKYIPELPAHRLATWVVTPCTNNYEAMASRVELSAQFLFAMKKETAITNNFSELPEINRIRILRAVMASGSPLTRRQFVSMAIQNCSKGIELEIWNMFSRHDFEIDDEILQAFASQAASLTVVNETDKNRKKQLERMLLQKIRQNAKKIDEKWLTEKLVEFAMNDDRNIRSDALSTLVELGKWAELAKILPGIDAEAFKRTLRSVIGNCGRDGQAITPALMDLFRLGLTDSEAATRTDTFRSVASVYYSTKNGDILTLLQETSRKETDTAVKNNMDDCLKSYLPSPAPSPSAAAPATSRRSSSSTAKNTSPAAAVAAAPPDPSGWPAIKVSGTVNSAGGKVAALINGQIVSEGESVSGVKIIAITRSGIQATFNGEKRSIPVRGGR